MKLQSLSLAGLTGMTKEGWNHLLRGNDLWSQLMGLIQQPTLEECKLMI